MKNVIKELLLMRKCMTNDYYISVKNKTNCFLNSCKKHKATKQVSFIFSISRVHLLSYCVIQNVYTLYMYLASGYFRFTFSDRK